jgi:hypothetical protein
MSLESGAGTVPRNAEGRARGTQEESLVGAEGNNLLRTLEDAGHRLHRVYGSTEPPKSAVALTLSTDHSFFARCESPVSLRAAHPTIAAVTASKLSLLLSIHVSFRAMPCRAGSF